MSTMSFCDHETGSCAVLVCCPPSLIAPLTQNNDALTSVNMPALASVGDDLHLSVSSGRSVDSGKRNNQAWKFAWEGESAIDL
jgi:hypothetical protein